MEASFLQPRGDSVAAEGFSHLIPFAAGAAEELNHVRVLQYGVPGSR